MASAQSATERATFRDTLNLYTEARSTPSDYVPSPFQPVARSPEDVEDGPALRRAKACLWIFVIPFSIATVLIFWVLIYAGGPTLFGSQVDQRREWSWFHIGHWLLSLMIILAFILRYPVVYKVFATFAFATAFADLVAVILRAIFLADAGTGATIGDYVVIGFAIFFFVLAVVAAVFLLITGYETARKFRQYLVERQRFVEDVRTEVALKIAELWQAIHDVDVTLMAEKYPELFRLDVIWSLRKKEYDSAPLRSVASEPVFAKATAGMRVNPLEVYAYQEQLDLSPEDAAAENYRPVDDMDGLRTSLSTIYPNMYETDATTGELKRISPTDPRLQDPSSDLMQRIRREDGMPAREMARRLQAFNAEVRGTEGDVVMSTRPPPARGGATRRRTFSPPRDNDKPNGNGPPEGGGGGGDNGSPSMPATGHASKKKKKTKPKNNLASGGRQVRPMGDNDKKKE